MKSPIEFFFGLSEKVTKGDIKRKADFDYYLFWIMFLAFFIVFLDNMIKFFFFNGTFTNFGWGLVMLAILWFQYHGLKSMYEVRKMLNTPKEEIKVESEKEMLDGFQK